MSVVHDDTPRPEMVENLNTRNGNFLCGVIEGFYGKPWTPEQRKDLFLKMNKLGMNAYVYAPKDDCKHRAYWRELYSVEEAEHLTSLIQAANDNGVIFYYALSPGLDITYSSTKEITSLKRKLEQVSQFGCTAFSLLFDDIEPEMGEADKEIFQSFAHAQVSVTNEVYQHLSQPKFLFCPTEYSASRAMPNVQNSEYLNTVGSKLLPGIDILWTGAKVITKNITLQSIEELTEVLRRPPVIWDNLHANDYDQRRIFLGPYSGRSPDLIPYLHGSMLNPNCEYEANFIPIHTLAQWSRCSVDGKRELNMHDSISADIKLETESENGSVEDIPSHLGPNTYHPKKALKMAVNDWLPEFSRPKQGYGKIIKPLISSTIPPVVTCMNVLATPTTNTTTTATASSNMNQLPNLVEVSPESTFQPIMNPVMNSLISATHVATNLLPDSEGVPCEPMDCNPTPGSLPKFVQDLNSLGIPGPSCGLEVKDEDVEIKMQESGMEITYEDVAILVDLFYLPFEHGGTGLQLLQEFQWLKVNAHLTHRETRASEDEAVKLQSEEWFQRAEKFDELSKAICQMLVHFNACPNRSLLFDMYPYMWDLRGVVVLMNSYVKWLAMGHVPQTVASYVQGAYTWFTKGWKEAFMNGDQEPWVFRGGLTAELQRLIPLENSSDLFIWKPPDMPSSKMHTIRPYLPADQSAVYEVCRRTCNDGADGSAIIPDYPDLMGDKLVGGFLTLSPEFCFVVEDETGICGYAVSALDAKQFFVKMELAWIPEMCAKYPQVKKDANEMMTPAEEVMNSFHCYKPVIPDALHKLHPSILNLNLLSTVSDLSVGKCLLICVMAALRANGSFGAFCEINTTDKNMREFYSKLSFLEINMLGEGPPDVIYLGRAV